MPEQTCERCNLPAFSAHRTVFQCLSALRREVESRGRTIEEKDERVRELEKELRAKEWEAATT